MGISGVCEHCGKAISIPDRLIGRKVACPKCKQPVSWNTSPVVSPFASPPVHANGPSAVHPATTAPRAKPAAAPGHRPVTTQAPAQGDEIVSTWARAGNLSPEVAAALGIAPPSVPTKRDEPSIPFTESRLFFGIVGGAAITVLALTLLGFNLWYFGGNGEQKFKGNTTSQWLATLKDARINDRFMARRSATAAIQEIPPDARAIPTLFAELVDPKSPVRYEASEILRRFQAGHLDDSLLPMLLEARDDPKLKNEAETLIVKLGSISPAAADISFEILQQSDDLGKAGGIANLVCETLPPSERVARFLAEKIRSNDAQARHSAIYFAAGQRGFGKVVVPPIIELMGSLGTPDPEILRTLRAQGDESAPAVPRLRNWALNDAQSILTLGMLGPTGTDALEKLIPEINANALREAGMELLPSERKAGTFYPSAGPLGLAMLSRPEKELISVALQLIAETGPPIAPSALPKLRPLIIAANIEANGLWTTLYRIECSDDLTIDEILKFLGTRLNATVSQQVIQELARRPDRPAAARGPLQRILDQALSDRPALERQLVEKRNTRRFVFTSRSGPGSQTIYYTIPLPNAAPEEMWLSVYREQESKAQAQNAILESVEPIDCSDEEATLESLHQIIAAAEGVLKQLP